MPELVEVHVRYLGQTGEQKALARRVLERSVARTVGGHRFRVPAPEERVIISTLQRMYRHLYFRLCDMADFAGLLNDRAIDFAELRRAAEMGGIWPGVATFLLLIAEYVKAYGCHVELPRRWSRRCLLATSGCIWAAILERSQGAGGGPLCLPIAERRPACRFPRHLPVTPVTSSGYFRAPRLSLYGK